MFRPFFMLESQDKAYYIFHCRKFFKNKEKEVIL